MNIMSNMAINTNILALNSHRSLKGVGAKQEKASTRLSSGYRINSAADDAAGLAISEKMRSQIRGLDMASKNTQDAVSLIQTAEGGMQEIDNMLQRIRELAVQASSDTNDQDNTDTTSTAQGDRTKIQDEINQLIEEIDSMAERVEFNKKKVISGDYAKGTAAHRAALKTAKDNLATAGTNLTNAFTDTIKANLSDAIDAVAAGSDANKADFDVAAKKLLNATSASEIAAAYAEMNAVTGITAGGTDLTAVTTALGTLVGNYTTAQGNVTTAQTNMAGDPEGLYFQVGANSNQRMELSINSVKTDELGIGDGNGTSTINVVQATGRDITAILDTLDTALTYVTTERSKLGAAQNRLEYTQKSLDISSENLSASESRIRDTDMAKEMMNFTQANVLQQAATSMLAQANQSKQGILQLLQ
jgi:flagellin